MAPLVCRLITLTALWSIGNAIRRKTKRHTEAETGVVGNSIGVFRWAKDPNKCLNVIAGWNGNGNRLQLWECDESNPDFQFVLPPGGKGMIKWAKHPDKCLNVQSGIDRWGTAIQLWECADNADFHFVVPEGTGNIKWAKNQDKCFNLGGDQKFQLHGCWDDHKFVVKGGADVPPVTPPVEPPVSGGNSTPEDPHVQPPVEPPVSGGNSTPPAVLPNSPLTRPTYNGPADVFVMLGLTQVTNDGQLNDPNDFAWKLDKLRDAGVKGVMVDVWWGLTEREPRNYNFDAYQQLLGMVKERGLKLQFVASFHQCGGNVGDDCNIPLPGWVTQNPDIWFTDKHGNVNKEYITFFADDLKLQGGRTPVEIYSDWFSAMYSSFASDLGSTVVEIQVGLGPCGELRYPSYPLSRWNFPGTGEFQAYDKHALASLRAAGQSKGWADPPTDAGDYNSRPWDVGFFQAGFKSEYGRFFLDWYFTSMKSHGAKVLRAAALAFQGKVALAGKVAGIHWLMGHEAHAAELTAGYYNTNGRNPYEEVAELFASNGHASLDFTCLEMRNREQMDGCKPEDLVDQVKNAAKSKGIHFNGENALPRYDWTAYEKILQHRDALTAFTYLRLNHQLVTDDYDNFRRFVGEMRRR